MYLASGSPSRQELLTRLGVVFERLNTQLKSCVSLMKARNSMCVVLLRTKRKRVLLLHLSICPCWAQIPLSFSIIMYWKSPEMRRMLHQLSGQTRRVMTAVAVADRNHLYDCMVVTDVTFCVLSDDDILRYVASGEPLDKAGAYGIQGGGGCFVRKINGSYHAVMGLPLVETKELLDKFDALRER